MHSCQNDNWATFDFFAQSAIEGMRESELEGGPNIEPLVTSLWKRYGDFEAIGSEGRLQDKHFKLSAALVAKHDTSADIDAITCALRSSTLRYMDDVARMF